MRKITDILQAESLSDKAKAIVFDLDDTLYGEKEYVKSGYQKVATAFPQIENMEEKLYESFLKGGKAFDETLKNAGLDTEENKKKCLEIYRFQQPNIRLYDGVKEMLVNLREKGVKLGIITDGRVEGQKAKIDALGLNGLVDEIVITDELGGVEFRKPNEKAFLLMQEKLGVPFADTVYVGDNLQKDFIAPNKLGMQVCLFENKDGLYYVEDTYGTKLVQTELLAMMKDVHAFFEREGITYSLSGGSALGAVRHQGFIPWDDDMDVMMDRENYEKTQRVFHRLDGYELVKELWVYRIRRKNANIKDGYAPTIDIFVADNCPDKSAQRKWKILRLKILQGMMKEEINYKEYSFVYKICVALTHFFGKFFTKNWKWKKYDKISQVGNKKPTKYVTLYNDLFKLLGVRYDCRLMQKVQKTPFEDAEFYVTEYYDDFLTKQYGEYMTPPKEEDRISIHL